jgi:hypothetical protein
MSVGARQWDGKMEEQRIRIVGRAEVGWQWRECIEFAEGEYSLISYVFQLATDCGDQPNSGGWYKLRLVRITKQLRDDHCDCDFNDCEHQIVRDYNPETQQGRASDYLGTLVAAHYEATFDRWDYMRFKFMGQKCAAVRRKSDEEYQRVAWMNLNL